MTSPAIDKMHDEKIERDLSQVDEEIGGESSHLTRQVLWKLDLRYCIFPNFVLFH
jgi:hypothetical protein